MQYAKKHDLVELSEERAKGLPINLEKISLDLLVEELIAENRRAIEEIVPLDEQIDKQRGRPPVDWQGIDAIMHFIVRDCKEAFGDYIKINPLAVKEKAIELRQNHDQIKKFTFKATHNVYVDPELGKLVREQMADEFIRSEQFRRSKERFDILKEKIRHINNGQFLIRLVKMLNKRFPGTFVPGYNRKSAKTFFATREGVDFINQILEIGTAHGDIKDFRHLANLINKKYIRLNDKKSDKEIMGTIERLRSDFADCFVLRFNKCGETTECYTEDLVEKVKDEIWGITKAPAEWYSSTALNEVCGVNFSIARYIEIAEQVDPEPEKHYQKFRHKVGADSEYFSPEIAEKIKEWIQKEKESREQGI